MLGIKKNLIISIVIIFSLGFGGQPFKTRAAGAAITGRVVDQNGNDISGVQVLSHNGESDGFRTTTTSLDGSYTLVDVPEGSSHLQAKSEGSNLAMAHFWNFEVAPGGYYSDVVFTLRPGGGGINGWVLDASGNGIGEATVAVFEQTAQGFDNGAFATTVTGANGFFATSLTDAPGPGLPSGIYVVKASKAGLPDVLAGDVGVTAGAVTSGVVLSIISGSGEITGQITEASSGAGVAGAKVFVDNGVIQASTVTDEDGSYLVSYLPSGNYHLVVSKSGYATAHQYNLQVSTGSVVTGIDLPLTTSVGQISGRVINQNGQPVVGASILADSDQGTGFGNTTTGGNGEYLLTNLAPMTYYIHANASGLGGVILIAEVVEAQTTPGVDFVLSAASGGISGRIMKNGLPAAYANVFVNSSSGSDPVYYQDAIADSYGNYSVENLPPGEYDVHVSGVIGYVNMYRQNIQVGTGMVAGLVFSMANGIGSIEGDVTDATGKALMDAKIHLFQLSNPGSWASVLTDHAGYYSAIGLHAGEYQLFAYQNEYPTVIKSYLVVAAGEPARIDIVFGQERALLARPNELIMEVENNLGTFTSVWLDVTSGESAGWTAQSNAAWLLLGTAGESYEDSGQTGVDGLILRFDPTRVPYGRHTTEVLVTAPDALPTTVQVTMVKFDPDLVHQVFLPLVGGGK